MKHASKIIYILILLIIMVLILLSSFWTNKITSFVIKSDDNKIGMPSIPEGQEVRYLDYKYSKNKGVIILTEPRIYCAWKPDNLDDGWKSCEAVFEVQDSEKKLELPVIELDFKNKDNVRNLTISYSNEFSVADNEYLSFAKVQSSNARIKNTEKEKPERTAIKVNKLSYKKRKFFNFADISGKEEKTKEDKKTSETNLSSEDRLGESNVSSGDGSNSSIGNMTYEVNDSNSSIGLITGYAVSVPEGKGRERYFAVKVNFEMPKYESNQFDFKISGGDTVASIDPEVSECANLVLENGVFTLSQDIESASSCMTISADNITLDCRGHTINFSYDSSDELGININSRFAKVKNCKIVSANSIDSVEIGIYASNYSTIENNSVSILAEYGTGVYSDNKTGNTLQGNNITLYGPRSYGIYLLSGSNHSAANNTIYLNTSFSGIFVEGSINNNIVSNNITLSGDEGYGVFLITEANINKIAENRILIESDSGGGINIGEESNYNIIENNNITTLKQYEGGVSLESGTGNVISGNSISTEENYSHAVWLSQDFNSNITINDNNISTYGSQSYGIYLESDSDSVTLSNNTLKTFGQGSPGVFVAGKMRLNYFRNSYIQTNKANSPGIVFHNSVDSTDFSGVIIETAGPDSAAINLSRGSINFSMEDCVLNATSQEDGEIYISPGTSGLWNFTNTSFDSVIWPDEETGNLYVTNYLYLSGKYPNNLKASSVNITVYDNDGIVFAELTDEDGKINSHLLKGYVQSGLGGENLNYYNYTILVTKGSLIKSYSINLSSSRFLDFLLDISEGGNGGGGSGGGGGSINNCAASWNCTEWSECTSGARKRECTNLKPACNKDKPKTTLPCGINESEKRNALFDINTRILTKSVKNFEKLQVSIELINLGKPGAINATISYIIKDSTGRILSEEREVIPVETQTEFIKEFSLDGLKSGKYTISTELVYEGQKEPALSEEAFEIGNPSSTGWSYIILIAVLFMVLTAFFARFLFKRTRRFEKSEPRKESRS